MNLDPRLEFRNQKRCDLHVRTSLTDKQPSACFADRRLQRAIFPFDMELVDVAVDFLM